jgi:protein TonB
MKIPYQALLSIIFCIGCTTLCQTVNAQFVNNSKIEQKTSVMDSAITTTCQKPKYPRAALLKSAEGTVTLGFLIGVNGMVLESRVKKSSGNADLDDAALVALNKCKYEPAVIDGKITEAWSYVQYVWKLDEPVLRY